MDKISSFLWGVIIGAIVIIVWGALRLFSQGNNLKESLKISFWNYVEAIKNLFNKE